VKTVEEWLDFTQMIERVQELLDVGLDSEAADLLDRYADIYKGAWEIEFLYSRIHADQDRPEKAVECLFRCLRTEKNNLDVLLGLFYAFSQMGELRKAGRFLMRAEKNHPKNELVLSALIWYHTEMSELTKAIDCFETSRSILEESPEGLRNIGIAYERNGDNEKARSCFKQALEINPHFEDARDLLADHYIMCGEAEKGVALYREYLEESPNNIKALSRLVFCYSQNDQFDEAEKVVRTTIERYPNSPIGYVDLSYLYLNAGKHEAAIESANKALDVSPIDAEAYRVKGIAYSECNNNLEAQKAFDAAAAYDPHNPEILRDYYHHLRDAGKFDEMKEVVQRVIKQEKPYCMEDYWFLADYYQSDGKMLEAFHNLHKAYKSMPGEKELIPPMVDILLERRHEFYVLPFLKRYVESKGWNDVMDEFMSHKRLRGKWSQEGLRFLRYYSQKPHEFRQFIFRFYIRRFMVYGGLGLMPVVVALAAVTGNPRIAVLTGGIYLASLMGIVGIALLLGRIRVRLPQTDQKQSPAIGSA
jgi:tetratricopeptide (TPR) repeat protein